MASEFGLVGHKLKAGVHQKFHLAIPAIEFFSFIGRTIGKRWKNAMGKQCKTLGWRYGFSPLHVQ